MANTQFKTWMCRVCGFIYDENSGIPDDGIAPGSRREDLPADWTWSGLQGQQARLRTGRNMTHPHAMQLDRAARDIACTARQSASACQRHA